MSAPGTSTRPRAKSVHHACLHNLDLYLNGEISFEEWSRRQEELESRLTPEPELPFTPNGGDGNDEPQQPKAA